MTQEEIKLRQNQVPPFTHEEVDANWSELNARTEHDEDGYNSIAELGTALKAILDAAGVGLAEERVIGNVITSTTVNTTYTLDFTAASVWILQSTGTFSFVNGAFATNEKSIMKVVFLSGENAFTTGLGWVKDPDSDDYDGTKWNRIVLEIIRTAEFGFIVRYSIKNLEAVV